MNDPPTKNPVKAKRKSYFATVPPQEILPIVDRKHESSVQGIFVIGDVTGLPLVKIAANQGADVVQHIQPSVDDPNLDLVIIGAGPAGLAAAIEASEKGLRYVVLERSKIANTVRDFPPGKMVYAEPQSIRNQSKLDFHQDLDKDAFLQRVRKVVAEKNLHIKENTEVAAVAKLAERKFEVQCKGGKSFPARHVIVAVGRQGESRLLDCPGADNESKVSHRLRSAGDYNDCDVVVVGGGNSAIESALMLMQHNRVTLVYRGEELFRAKSDNRRLIEQAQADGKLEILYQSNVIAIRPTEVDVETDGQINTLPNDHVIVQIGTLPPIDFLLDMGLELDGVWNSKRIVMSIIGLCVGIFIYFFAKRFVLHPSGEGPGQTLVPGFSWLFSVVPTYFSNAYGFYYLLYFSAIVVFGLYWATRMNHRMIWRRNLIIIATQWTLWWGIPTGLAVWWGRNPWTPVLSKSLNAWPLNMGAFQVTPAVGAGDPAWWHTVAVCGVVWAVLLTFVIIPLFTIRWGKIYCSYVCSCGALAETVGNGYRHRGPKGGLPRKFERAGFIFIALACIATVADLYGFNGPLGWYNKWVGTLLAGAVAIGMYPFLGQRVWCRMWCPLAFWMNFWGRWSKFKITPEKGKCIDCNVCNQYCQMGIDIKSRALAGVPVTLADSPCVGCNECIVRCPMEILHLGDIDVKRTKGSSL